MASESMNVLDFLSALRQQDIRVWAENERLRYSAPPGALGPELRSELSLRKSEILAFLRAAAGPAAARIERVSRKGPLPLSFSQQRLWFLDRLDPEDPTYNIPAAVALVGQLDVAVLRRTFDEIVRRHESLRTRFVEGAEGGVQLIDPRRRQALPVLDLSALPAERREHELRRLSVEEAVRLFDLARGPLLRTTLVAFGESEHHLLLNQHHIVSDGWSLGVLLQEFGTLYPAFAAGEGSPLPELPVQYADFAVRQRGEALESQREYWRDKLAGTAPLDLPSDRPRPAVRSSRGAQVAARWSRRLTEALEALGRERQATLFMVLLAAFKTLLHRYTGQRDVAVGSPVAGRRFPEVEGLIGFFVNTLVLRDDLGGEPSFLELLERVHKTTLAAYVNQDLPFEKLVEELQPGRDLSRTPFFQVMLVDLNTPLEAMELGGMTLSPRVLDTGTAKFDLTVNLTPVSEGLTGLIEYSTELFDATSVRRLAGHFEILLGSIVERPEVEISRLALFSPAQRWQLLGEWNVPPQPVSGDPGAALIHRLFEAQAQRAPAACALVFGGRYLSYGELEARAERLAGHLCRLGVGPDVIVGILMERSPEMLVGMLAVLKAGGAYLPLDPDHPRERLTYVLEDSGAPLILSEGRFHERLGEHRARLVCLDTVVLPKLGTRSPPPLSPENLAYVLYTSGTTGRPKGVAVPHRSVVHFLESMRQEPGMGPEDRLLAVTTFTFDIHVLEIFLPLMVGARLVLASREEAADAQLLRKLVEEEGTSALQATPASWLLLLEAGWTGGAEGAGDLRMLCGGEALRRDLADRLLSSSPVLWNLYGPTETTVYATYSRVERGSAPITIGRPIARTRIRLLDRRLELVPAGVPGELTIGGAGLTRGYLGRGGLTAEKFIPDPFGDGERLYRTGDLARYLADGSIEYLGRFDQQVKVRGFRIELGEIEAHLAAHPKVAQAVAMARDDVSRSAVAGDVRLVAYVVPRGNGSPDAGALRSLLEAKLPPYMVPAAFVFLDELPLSTSGKVDRRALPAPELRAAVSQQRVPPRTELELTLAAVWCDILGCEDIGIHDDFFDLGGHSLLATQVFSRLREELAVELPVRSLFEAPTVAGLAQRIEAVRWAVESTSMAEVGPDREDLVL